MPRLRKMMLDTDPTKLSSILVFIFFVTDGSVGHFHGNEFLAVVPRVLSIDVHDLISYSRVDAAKLAQVLLVPHGL